VRERLSVKSGRVLGDRGFTHGNPDTRRTPAQEIQVNDDSMPSNLAHRVYDQVIQFLPIVIYLFVVFGVLNVHEEIVAAKNHISYHFYGFALVNALILGKVMLVAEDLNFANCFRNSPLVYPIVFKSVAFTILFSVFDIVEEVVVGVGVFKGKSIVDSFPDIGGGSPRKIFFMVVIIAILLIPFFAFREIGQVIGGRELHSLIFTPRRSQYAGATAGER
jgi:hypothetical protein